MDITTTLAANSDQVNAEDLLAGPFTVTITGVKGGTAEQPVFIELKELPDKTFRPGKTMRRLIVACWGPETSTYTGRRMTLYRDPDVKFGKEAVGGVRISHMSDLDKPVSVMLATTRGKRAPFVVQPLADTSGRDWLAELDLAGDDLDAITALGKAAGDAHAPADVLAVLRDRFRALTKAGEQ